MSDLIEQLDRALDLHVRGRPDEAADLGQSLLARSRGTPHAASVHRHQAEFLHATGNYPAARRMAEEAGALARATRHPSEILSATLTALRCDLYTGQLTGVHQQVVELIELAPRQPMPVAFLAHLLLLAGDFDRAIELAERARDLLDLAIEPREHPMLELQRADLLLIEARAELQRDAPRNAIARLERVLHQELSSQIPATLARALIGLAEVQAGEADLGRDWLGQAVASARRIAADLHGRCLQLAGWAHLELGEAGLAREQLRFACGLMVHPIERQEVHWRLGAIALLAREPEEAEQAFRRATEPTTETHYGRLSVQALHSLVGLRSV
jgi:tetratricopeptide (TPR) repeat protein